MADSLRPHELQHARPPCPSAIPRVHSDSRPSSRWCHPAISSSVIPFSSFHQSLPASESFPMSQLFSWGVQSIEVSALACPSKEYPGPISFRMDWLDRSPRDSQGSSPTPQFKNINSSALSFPYSPTLTSIHALTRWTFVSKLISLLFNMLSRFVIAFLPRRKHLLILWLESPSAIIWSPRK